jgi:hypothetical protein
VARALGLASHAAVICAIVRIAAVRSIGEALALLVAGPAGGQSGGQIVADLPAGQAAELAQIAIDPGALTIELRANAAGARVTAVVLSRSPR